MQYYGTKIGKEDVFLQNQFSKSKDSQKCLHLVANHAAEKGQSRERRSSCEWLEFWALPPFSIERHTRSDMRNNRNS